MKSYEIQVDLYGDGKWTPSMETTARDWKRDLERHKKAGPEPARAVKIKFVRTLRILCT